MAEQRRQLNLKVDPKVYSRLCAKASALGYTATGYATLLFEAAYAARIGQEREAPVADRELDEQVRLVFALAGQADTAAIARATGIGEPLVARILEAWRREAKAA